MAEGDEEAEERSSPSGKIVYKAILNEAEDELERPSAALFWSDRAAGLSMGFSLVAEGLIRSHLPDRPRRPLVKLGYSIGFLIVILGRQQLFTENTLTPVLPLLIGNTLGGVTLVSRTEPRAGGCGRRRTGRVSLVRPLLPGHRR